MEQKFKHFAEVDISLNVKNNRGYTQTANLMGNPYNLLDTANAVTEYKWDLTGFAFTTETYVTLEYRDVNSASFSLFTQDLTAQTIDAVVNALNLLGIGFFYLDTTGGTFITTSNDAYVFGNLAIEPTSGTTTTTTTTSTTVAPTTTTTTTSTTAAPTTTTTTTSTTAAPTTTTTTTSTTTAAPTTTTTTTSTTAAPTTTTTTTSTTLPPTTTTTTTTTSTAPFFFLIGFGGAAEDACGFLASATVQGDNASFCSCTTFTGGIFAAASTGTWYVSYGGDYVSVSVTNGNPVATVTSACAPCPSPTTTTTTTSTTSAPTTTTTTSTTTAAPTTTTTTTTTTIVFYTFCLGFDASSSTAACNDYLSFCT